MNDPRLSGDLWLLWNRSYLPGGQAISGTVELTNDDGTWVGTMRGYKIGGLHYWQVELTGTGAYEGLSALLNHRGVSAYRHEVEGFVFPGVLPERPEPVEPPAE